MKSYIDNFDPLWCDEESNLPLWYLSSETWNHNQIMRKGLPWWLSGKESTYQAGDSGSIPGLGRSPREGDGKPLQYSCLGNPTDRGDWQATVYGVAKSQTQLSDLTTTIIMSKTSNKQKLRSIPQNSLELSWSWKSKQDWEVTVD